MTRSMFAGELTPVGFVNFFDQIMPINRARKRLILKGSSGSGKSTFMKKIAAGFEGYDMDIYHCANDADSLDGLSVLKKGFCIIDGTAPHVFEPEIPGAIDKAIDFARFIDESKVSGYEEEIKGLVCKKKLLTEKARGFFAAAGSVYLAERAVFEAAVNTPSLQELTYEWAKALDGMGMPRFTGVDRKMFLTAVTPDGVVNFAETVLYGHKVYGLNGESGAGTDVFLAKLRDEANVYGIDTESFFCPFDPGKLEYLLLPAMKTAFAVMGAHCGYSGHTDEIIDFSGCYDAELLESAKSGTQRSGGLFDKLLDETIAIMGESRAVHAGIERIYVNTINFEGINELTERIMIEL